MINDYIYILDDIITNLIEIKIFKSNIDKKEKIEKCINIIKNDIYIIDNLGLIRKLNKKDNKNYDKLLKNIYNQLKQINFIIIRYKNRIKRNNKTWFLYFRTNLKEIIYYLDLLNNSIKWLPNYHFNNNL